MEERHVPKKIISEITKRIIDIAMPEKVILFGSYAYGVPYIDSDIDIMVVKKDIESKIKEYSKIRKALKGLGYPLDILILTLEEFEYYSTQWSNSIAAEVKNRGIILYDKQKRA